MVPSVKKNSSPSKDKASEKEKEQNKTVALNRKAFHDYDILDTIEAGIALRGSEIKSIRAGGANIREAFAKIEKGELWLYNAHIAKYDASGPRGHDPTRTRKLLLHRSQLDNWSGRIQEKNLTLIPLKMYLKKGRAKIELGLAKGRKLYDKREQLREKDMKRELRATTLQRQ